MCNASTSCLWIEAAPSQHGSIVAGSVEGHQSQGPQGGNELRHSLRNGSLSIRELIPGGVGYLLQGGATVETTPDRRTQFVESDPFRVPGPSASQEARPVAGSDATQKTIAGSGGML